MNPTIYNFTLDLQSPVSQAVLSARKGDRARFASVTFMSGGVPYAIEHGCYAVLNAVRESDGAMLFADCIIEDDSVTFNVSNLASGKEGRVDCDLTLYSPSGEAITSPKFAVVVYAGTTTGEDIEETKEYKTLGELVAAAESAKEEAQAYAGNAAVSANEAAHGGAVSFNGRVGAVYPEAGDYTAEMVGAEPTGNLNVHKDDPGAHAELFKQFGMADLEESIGEVLDARKSARIECGTYTGAGTCGAEAPNTLEFDFRPKIVFVFALQSTSQGAMAVLAGTFGFVMPASTYKVSSSYDEDGNRKDLVVEWQENKIQWYFSGTTSIESDRNEMQMNGSGENYYYIAIG